MGKQSSFKIWEGPSAYNQKTISAILTRVINNSKNPKTGPMSQCFYLMKDISPIDAIRCEDGDRGVCGSCVLRPEFFDNIKKALRCYTSRKSYQAPLSVWSHNIMRPVQLAEAIAAIKSKPKPIRFGAHGDPAMMPQDVFMKLVASLDGLSDREQYYTAYTHQMRHSFADWLKPHAMASVENLADAHLYQCLGWRTFRITDVPEAEKGEIICPNFINGIKCFSCLLCNGRRGPEDTRKNITVPKH